MSQSDFDVIVVGARCAGAPLAMLLARKGHRVLVVDRATFPSDTLSTHVIQPHGVAALARWGLLDRLLATGCPTIHTYAFHFGPLTISGAPGTPEAPIAVCPRRTVLDELLVRAAAQAGAEVREAFTVNEVVVSDGRVTGIRGHSKGSAVVTVRAPLVIGADGRKSVVAKAVAPETYHERPVLQGGYYAYWSGLPMNGRFEIHVGDRCGLGAAETHDGLTMVVGGWPHERFREYQTDSERHYLSLLDQAPGLRERMRGARRESQLFGAATPNFFRKPFGPGWALAGDAGYIKDPITAQGIADAFLDAERLATAVHEWRSGVRSYEAIMAEYQSARDARALPMYELTCQLAALEPPPPDLVQLLTAIRGNPEAAGQFCRVNAGVTPPAELFAPANVARILAAAARSSASPDAIA